MQPVSAKYTHTHNLILDAAVICYERLGINQTAMVDIAQQAEIGRTTLYRHFKSQDDVLMQAVIRDIYQIFEQLTECLDSQSTLEDKIVEGMLFCLQAFSQRPVLSLMLQADSASSLIDLGINANELNDTGAKLTSPIYELAKEQKRLRDNISLPDFVEWVTRVLISLQATPGQFDNNPDKTRHFLHKFLVPSLLCEPTD